MSTDTTRKFPVAAVCAVLFALCIPGGVTRLTPCTQDGLFEVVENSPTNKLTCDSGDLMDSFYVRIRWYWLTNATTVRIGDCEHRSCHISHPFMTLFSVSSLLNGTVQLTIDTTNMTLFSRSDSFTNSTISCEIMSGPFRMNTKATCRRTDLVYPAKDSKCNTRFQTSANEPWSVETKCNVTKAYSALQRYSCKAFIAQEALGSPVPMNTSRLDNDYVSGSCFMASVMPSVDGNLTVMVSPGRINVSTSEVRQPSCVRLDHSCPPYVDEGSDLGCRCTTNDRGSPPGFLQWQGSSSADLRRANVSMADDGTVFICHLLWNAKRLASTTYTLRVISIGYLIRQAMSEGRASGQITGIGIGVGFGLTIAVIAVAVLVVFSWRRGWVLRPCAATPDTTKREADNMRLVDASNIFQASHEGVGAAAVPETGNEGPMPYEDMLPNEVNVPSVYEALRTGKNARATAAPDRTETRSVYQNCAFDSDNDRGGEVPEEKKKPKKRQKKTQNVVAVAESPLYGNV